VRVPSIGAEALTSPNVPARFGDSGETIKSQIAGNSSPAVTCPDGITERTANQPANCYRSFTGKPVLLYLSWSLTATKNRFLIGNDGPVITPGSCGSQIVGALVLVGVKKSVLPLNLVGYRVNYDEPLTNAATLAEVHAMRAGRRSRSTGASTSTSPPRAAKGSIPVPVAFGDGSRTSTAISARSRSASSPGADQRQPAHSSSEPRDRSRLSPTSASVHDSASQAWSGRAASVSRPLDPLLVPTQSGSDAQTAGAEQAGRRGR